MELLLRSPALAGRSLGIVVQRDFCIACGLPFDQRGDPARCRCGIASERLAQLEREEQELLREYAAAHYLAPWQMALHVRTRGGTQTVRDFLVELQHEDLIREYAVKMTRDHLVQLIYQEDRGCRLVKWPLV